MYPKYLGRSDKMAELEAVLQDLTEALGQLNLGGKVSGIAVRYSKGRGLNWYGFSQPDPALVLLLLNQSIGVSGRLHFINDRLPRSHQSGFFVPAMSFGLGQGKWIALVNIPLSPEDFAGKAYRYSL